MVGELVIPGGEDLECREVKIGDDENYELRWVLTEKSQKQLKIHAEGANVTIVGEGIDEAHGPFTMQITGVLIAADQDHLVVNVSDDSKGKVYADGTRGQISGRGQRIYLHQATFVAQRETGSLRISSLEVRNGPTYQFVKPAEQQHSRGLGFFRH